MNYIIILQVPQTATQTVADTMATAAQTAAPVAEQSISLWDLAQKGGPILIPIGILSVMAVYIFFERYFTILRYSKWDVNFMNMIRDHVHTGNIDRKSTRLNSSHRT